MVYYYHIRQREGEMKHSVVISDVNIWTDSFWVCMSECVCRSPAGLLILHAL